MSPRQRHIIASSSNVRDNVDSMERSKVVKASGPKPQQLAAPTLLQPGKDGIKRLATSTSCTGMQTGSEIRNLIYRIFLQPTK